MHQVEISASVCVVPVSAGLGGGRDEDLGRVVGTLGRARESDEKRVRRSESWVVDGEGFWDEDGGVDWRTGHLEGMEGRSVVEDEGR